MTKTKYTLATTLGGAAIALAMVNGAMITSNQAVQAELSQKQGYLQQTGQLEGIYTHIVTMLAQLALNGNDLAVTDMLGSLGLKVAPGDAAAASHEGSTDKKK